MTSHDDGKENIDNTEVLDEKPRRIILGLISQIRKGTELHRISLPAFIFEPRSMLERITDFMSHPELILRASKQENNVQRFISVVRYYLSGWHVKPKGVKKSYNPILGEFFRARWKFHDNTNALYIAEQVSHHPPVSAYYYASPENNILIYGTLRPKSKFMGNSAGTMMHGETKFHFTNRPDEVYRITMPNFYARGILFGKVVMELGDKTTIICEKTGLMYEMQFQTKGYFSGAYNSIYGKIILISTGEALFEISGKWSDIMYITNLKTGKKEILFNALESSISPKTVEPEDKQHEKESRKLWSKFTNALLVKNFDLASQEKFLVEEKQRKDIKLLEADWKPKYFTRNGTEYLFNHMHNPDAIFSL
ncbi:Oxysterol-binding protein [Gigaspora margarita]|uniref:Oxysterol-binding protein n=2 Tax=Gigaspora margarita TaxID=4874 RepID=A0A8H4EGC3_GIGMA|nr:Oxysterol-binding protein [Gigaspora margarita]